MYCAVKIPQSDCIDEQADLGLHCLHILQHNIFKLLYDPYNYLPVKTVNLIFLTLDFPLAKKACV